jgi:alkanesulfonate monooxygenase SsuD/methylene tetrahydromethanopterin reductase-like flavin-dependent oxidoreductase (luciferase family)
MELKIAFNMRAPEWGGPAADLYAAALDMSAWADDLGFSTVMLSEHHNTADGYLPSPIVMAGAVGARTRHVDIKLSVVLATLMHPIHLAEDLAVADLVSGGRLHVTLGAGYRKAEFLVFQVNWKKRPSAMVEIVETLRVAWTGEEFSFRGTSVRVLPKPARPGGPPLALAGTSDGSARRAAALDLVYEPLGDQFYEVYLQERRRLGKPLPPPRRDNAERAFPQWIGVADDPDAYWAKVGDHVLHNVNEYAGYAQRKDLAPFKSVEHPDQLLERGAAKVYRPEELIEACQRAETGSVLRFNPLEGGIPPDLAWPSLRLFEEKVMPYLPA